MGYGYYGQPALGHGDYIDILRDWTVVDAGREARALNILTEVRLSGAYAEKYRQQRVRHRH